MNVLLVSYSFPPSNLVGGVRVGKFAKYLHEAGHDIRVLTADNPYDRSLPLEIPAERVTYVAAGPAERFLDPLIGSVRRLQKRLPLLRPRRQATSPPHPQSAIQVGTLRRHYYALQIPDAHARWMRAVTEEGASIVRHWRPDMIFASAPPFSGLIAAHRIASLCGAPWIAELRDLWSDNPYYGHPLWRWLTDRLIERSVLRDATGLVTVTPIWTETLRRHYRQPVACVLNGYVKEDYPVEPTGPPPRNVVSILYTGNIYPGYRDPSPLFQAIDLLGSTRRAVEVHFYGPPREAIFGLAAAQPVQQQIVVHDRVPYKSSLALQTSADILLLLQWTDARDAGNLPAKFFEYLGARRPILMLGYEQGDLAQMVRERRAGLVANDPAAIAQQLRSWLGQRPSGIPAVDPQARVGMTRAEQFRKYEQFLIETVSERA